MGGVASSSVGFAIHYGSQQCSSGFPFQTQSNLRVEMDPEDRGLSGSSQEVVGFHRSLRHLSKSPILSIFFSVPRSECSGHRCAALELEWVAGICLSSLVSHSSGVEEAPVVLWSPPDHHCSILASEALVSGASESGGGRSDPSSIVSRPPETTALPMSSSGSVRTVSSCVETYPAIRQVSGFLLACSQAGLFG